MLVYIICIELTYFSEKNIIQYDTRSKVKLFCVG